MGKLLSFYFCFLSILVFVLVGLFGSPFLRFWFDLVLGYWGLDIGDWRLDLLNSPGDGRKIHSVVDLIPSSDWTRSIQMDGPEGYRP